MRNYNGVHLLGNKVIAPALQKKRKLITNVNIQVSKNPTFLAQSGWDLDLVSWKHCEMLHWLEAACNRYLVPIMIKISSNRLHLMKSTAVGNIKRLVDLR